MDMKYILKLFRQCSSDSGHFLKSWIATSEVNLFNYEEKRLTLDEAGDCNLSSYVKQLGPVCVDVAGGVCVTSKPIKDNMHIKFSTDQDLHGVVETKNLSICRKMPHAPNFFIDRDSTDARCSHNNNTLSELNSCQTNLTKEIVDVTADVISPMFILKRSLGHQGSSSNLPNMSLPKSHILGQWQIVRSSFSKMFSELKLSSCSMSTEVTSSQTVSAAWPEKSRHVSSDTNKMQFYRRQLPETCTSFCSEEGKKIFAEALTSGHMDSYFQLASQFMTQDEPAYCGLSTLVMVLNALEIDPNRVWKAPWRWYDERMLDCCVPLSIVQQLGVTMDQLACLAACNNLHVDFHRADSSDAAAAAEFRNIVIMATQRTDIVVVAAYSRKALKQTGDGHFACIGGYNPNRDLVLIMDTARFKYPPHWVPVNLLHTAMQAADSNTGLPRGYLVLSKSKMPKALLFHLTSDISPISAGQTVTDDNNVKTSLDYLLAFADAWEAWLGYTPANGETGILEEAVEEMIRLLKGRRLPLCTSMIRGKRTLEEWRRHQKDVVDLIGSLEELHLFKLTHKSCVASLYQCDEQVSNTSALCETNVSTPESSATTMSCCKATADRDLKTVASFHIDREAKSELKKEAQSISVPLSRSHFATMLLLSWPYHRCTSNRSGRSRGHILMEEVQALLSSRGNTELLEREATRLRQQLASILIYLRSSSARNK